MKSRKKKATKKTVKKATKVKAKKKTVAPKKSTRAKQSSQRTKRKTTPAMSDFEQCVILAAVINQLRETDPDFRLLPLPEVNSTALTPLRKHFAKSHFTPGAVIKAVTALLKSKDFKNIFPMKHALKLKLHIKDNDPLMIRLLELAGLEAKRPIYFAEHDPHDIQKTTLEKHAVKLGLIPFHYLETLETHHQPESPLMQKRIFIQLNYEKMDKNRQSHLQMLSAKHRRGRG